MSKRALDEENAGTSGPVTKKQKQAETQNKNLPWNLTIRDLKSGAMTDAQKRAFIIWTMMKADPSYATVLDLTGYEDIIKSPLSLNIIWAKHGGGCYDDDSKRFVQDMWAVYHDDISLDGGGGGGGGEEACERPRKLLDALKPMVRDMFPDFASLVSY